MKKFISLVLTVALAISSLACVSAAEEEIKVYLDGNKINFDVQPQIINDYTMVPLRAIFEKLRENVTWDGATQAVISTKGSTTSKMTLNSTTVYTNDIAYEIDVAPTMINDKTLVPLRYVAETFGCDVDWDADTKSVIITSNTTTASEASSSSFDKLKDTIIISNGIFQRVSADCYYYFPLYYKDGTICSTAYDAESDVIIIDLDSEDGFSTMVTVSSSENPDILFKLETSDKEYHLFGKYTQLNKPYEEKINTVPSSMQDEATKLINSSLKFIDEITTRDTNISLSDFGVYYEK